MSDKYNGWTNYETWRTALEFVDSDYFADVDCGSIDELADYIHEFVTEYMMEEQPDERRSMSAYESLASSLVDQFFRRVNWLEIAELVAEGHNLFTDEECA